MTYEELQSWFEQHRTIDLREATTKAELREVFRKEREWLAPKAREVLFDYFLRENPLATGIGEGLPEYVEVSKGAFNWGKPGVRYRDTRTGRFVRGGN